MKLSPLPWTRTLQQWALAGLPLDDGVLLLDLGAAAEGPGVAASAVSAPRHPYRATSAVSGPRHPLHRHMSAVMMELAMLLPRTTRFSNQTKSRYRYWCLTAVMVNTTGRALVPLKSCTIVETIESYFF